MKPKRELKEIMLELQARRLNPISEDEDPFDLDGALVKPWWEIGILPLGAVVVGTIEREKILREDSTLVQVSHCPSFDEVWVCPSPWSPRDELLENMNEFYFSEDGAKWCIPNTSHIIPGRIYAGNYKTYGYHRVLVKHILSSSLVTVVYVDFGTEEMLSVDQLRLLHKKFLSTPVQALQTRLWRIEEVPGDASKCRRELMKMVSKRNFEGMSCVQVVHERRDPLRTNSGTFCYDDDKPSVLLFDIFNGSCINQELVNQGSARLSKEDVVDEGSADSSGHALLDKFFKLSVPCPPVNLLEPLMKFKNRGAGDTPAVQDPADGLKESPAEDTGASVDYKMINIIDIDSEDDDEEEEVSSSQPKNVIHVKEPMSKVLVLTTRPSHDLVIPINLPLPTIASCTKDVFTKEDREDTPVNGQDGLIVSSSVVSPASLHDDLIDVDQVSHTSSNISNDSGVESCHREKMKSCCRFIKLGIIFN